MRPHPIVPPIAVPSLVGAALAYAVHGWPVFLLLPPDRTPPTVGRSIQHGGATRDPARIRAMVDRYPAGLLAIQTGAASGLAAIEVDPDGGGRRSLAALDADGLLPGTLMADTGSGKLHLIYAHPGVPIRSGTRLLGPGIGVQADGGYIVVSPSRHPRTGGLYRWHGGSPFTHPPAALHPRLAARLAKTPPHRRHLTLAPDPAVSERHTR
ncbi:hypothetical protein Val02_68950 [Virgisporangium aliadipatigenens]|uniref:DNA primase/polymerase bifunctional N-terminal domain-containing protein n=1 Tax=Virgisporangium aliadipatigenens TaxID=741659 RepID=A0A8J3YQV7_9ACTN|nr:bifunctional DNA primase/polymerase [Virgisporangium aliadipatigenens]GIJ50009.1 hypothetical protein Val02_68950 [Virgisporangium aliadipatigenens]